MSKTLKETISNVLMEVEQPQSQGEKNFKALHNAVNHVNLVPGVTDQEHLFKGSTQPYNNKYPNSYKPGDDRGAYDKTLKSDNKETDNGYETAHVEEAMSRNWDATHTNDKDISHRKPSMKDYRRPGVPSKEHLRTIAADAMRMALAKKKTNEEVEQVDEAKWMEKDLPGRNYNKDGYSEKGDIHHIEVHPELLKKHAIIHQVTHDGEYGPTHHFEHPTHGKVAVYQSGLNKKSGNPIISVRTYGPQGAKPVAHEFAGMFKGKTMHVYNESVNENYDDTPEEVSMVRTELKAIVADAQSLLDNMPSDMHIEPWVQSKIAVAKSMVNGVHDYMLYSDDDDKPSDMRSPMPSMSNPFSTNEENDLDEKLSPEQLKKFAKLAPPYDKITHADKIVAVKKKEAGQKVLPEASAIERHAMNMARQAMRRLKPEMKHTMHTKMNTPKDKLNMNKGDK